MTEERTPREKATAARPGVAFTPAGGSLPRLILHGLSGWAACGVTMGGLLAVAPTGTALVLHALAAPVIFAIVAWHYFRKDGARAPLPTALAFVAIVALLDLVVVAGLVLHSLAMFGSLVGTWLPFALIVLATWMTGEVMSTTQWPEIPDRARIRKGRA